MCKYMGVTHVKTVAYHSRSQESGGGQQAIVPNILTVAYWRWWQKFVPFALECFGDIPVCGAVRHCALSLKSGNKETPLLPEMEQGKQREIFTQVCKFLISFPPFDQMNEKNQQIGHSVVLDYAWSHIHIHACIDAWTP